ncbi:hypothetical protein ABWW58_14390 [Sporolactobacillus sp. STCC-11]|uniref:hypothetical protein n=1 Tax=Sporolactobacillus caesalpiniae TaxID=3230362 RepID=UPI003397247F
MVEREKYINDFEANLLVPETIKNKILIDIKLQIDEEVELGRDINDVLSNFGSPKAFADEFNENYFEYNEVDYFEYKSKKNKKYPLIHIVLVNKKKKASNWTGLHEQKVPAARGFLAIGKKAIGIIAIGKYTCGLISVGFISLGLFSIGLVSIGFFAVSCISLGGFSAGNIALGVLTLGNIAYGHTAFGNIAYGKYAVGNIGSGSGYLSLGNNPSAQEIVDGLTSFISTGSISNISKVYFEALIEMLTHPLIFIIAIITLVLFFAFVILVYSRLVKKVYPK